MTLLHRHQCLWLFAVALSIRAAAAEATPEDSSESVRALLREVAAELPDAGDRAAVLQLLAAFERAGSMTPEPQAEWVVLTFNRAGVLSAVRINTTRLLAAPPLVQRAVILHEVEHIIRTPETAERLAGIAGMAPAGDRPQRIVCALVDDEFRAYRRDVDYVSRAVRAHGGLAAYLQGLPPAHRRSMHRYYRTAVEPFLAPDGGVDERRLRFDGIFFRAFARQYPRHYEAALAWEALQGHATLRRGSDGFLRVSRMLEPAAFLAWLVPAKILPTP